METTPQKLEKAFAYLRVSGPAQLDGDGFPRQEGMIASYAKASGFQVTKTFREKGVCGATEWQDRKAWMDLLLSLNGVKTIIVASLDRLARDVMVQERIMLDLKKRGVNLLSAAEGDLSSDSTRKLFRQIIGIIAEYERDMIAFKLKSGKARARAEGRRAEGRLPYGHEPEELEVIQEMKRMRDTGKSWDQIAHELNRLEVPTKSGAGLWIGSTINKIFTRLEKE